MENDVAQELAAKLCYSVSPFGIVEPAMIVPLALAALALPTMATATQEESQRIFDALVGHISAQQVGIEVARSAHFLA
jgi:hypothetical protein